jgi:adenylate cyclase class 2
VREVELKAVVTDANALRARLLACDAVSTFVGALVDRRFDTGDGALLSRDHVLRMRTYRSQTAERTVLDWKGATSVADGYKIREEHSIDVADGPALLAILEGLGFGVVREIERDVETYDVEGAMVRLEWYPRLDVLVEVEGDPPAIERAVECTGIPRSEFSAERLNAFVARFEARTGQRAALSRQELAAGPGSIVR